MQRPVLRSQNHTVMLLPGFLASPTTAPFWKQKFLLDVPGLLRIETNWNKFFYFYYYYELQ